MRILLEKYALRIECKYVDKNSIYIILIHAVILYKNYIQFIYLYFLI